MSSSPLSSSSLSWRAMPAQAALLERLHSFGRFLRRNPALVIGLILLAVLFLFAFIGALVTDPKDAQPLAAAPLQKPSAEYPFGTDKLGRNLFATIAAGIPLTLRIGLFAGLLGLGIGALLGFVSAYYGGWADNLIRGVVDVGLTVPGLMVLIILAISFSGSLNVNNMALIVAVLAWLYPARIIRAQVLTLKQRPYVEVARLTGMSGLEIIFFELMPNLLPYLAASLVAAISSAILASIGLEALGLGPIDSPTLGMTIYWVNYNAAIIN
ncbi:MAG TPA: ABC transporter permease, partial [Caldilineaceae bacterium]|nr:ABC transporter permease [Caldilineaceae bacterium]